MSRLEKKVGRVVALRTETPEMREALSTVSEFWSGDTSETRRNLRTDLERRNVELAESYVASFASVLTALSAVDAKSELLETRATTMHDEVKRTDAEARRVVATYEALSSRREQVAERLRAVEAFQRRYSISEAESVVLRAGEIDDGFFDALERAQSARDECTLALQQGDAAVGFEMLERVQLEHDAAFERLFEWTLVAVGGETAADRLGRALALEDAPTAVRRALRALKSRPAMFDECQSVCVASRGELIERRFALATPNADVTRHVPDMLAWAHESVATEFEVLRALFQEDDRDLVGRILESLAAPLSAKIKAELRSLEKKHSQLDAAVRECVGPLHKLAQLLRFYSTTLAASVNGKLPEAVGECADFASQERDDLLKRRAEFLDLAPPAAFHDTDGLSREAARTVGLLRDANTALMTDSNTLDSLIRATLNPIINGAERCLVASPTRRIFREGSATTDFVGVPAPSDPSAPVVLPTWSPQLAAAVCANNAQVARRSLAPQASALELALFRELESLEQRGVEACARHEVHEHLARCGLEAVLDFARQQQLVGLTTKPCSSQVDAATLGAALRTFYSSLFSLSTPGLEHLADELRDRARTRTSRLLAGAHEAVYNAARNQNSGYQDTSFLVHTPQQVRVLLDCD